MAAPALQPVRRAVKRFVQWVNTYTGYTEDQLRGGLQVKQRAISTRRVGQQGARELLTALHACRLQVLVGLFILMATCSAPTVWNALTLADAAIIPTYAIVTFCVVLQPNLGEGAVRRRAAAWLVGLVQVRPNCLSTRPPCAHPAGTASQFVVMRVVGAVVGGLLGLICMYVTYGANGGTYSASLTKVRARSERGRPGMLHMHAGCAACSQACMHHVNAPRWKGRHFHWAPAMPAGHSSTRSSVLRCGWPQGAVMVTLLAFFAFLLNLFRFRHPRFWFAFVVGTFRCAAARPQRHLHGPGNRPPRASMPPWLQACKRTSFCYEECGSAHTLRTRLPHPPAACPWWRSTPTGWTLWSTRPSSTGGCKSRWAWAWRPSSARLWCPSRQVGAC